MMLAVPSAWKGIWHPTSSANFWRHGVAHARQIDAASWRFGSIVNWFAKCEQAFYEKYPGWLTTADGPKMDDAHWMKLSATLAVQDKYNFYFWFYLRLFLLVHIQIGTDITLIGVLLTRLGLRLQCRDRISNDIGIELEFGTRSRSYLLGYVDWPRDFYHTAVQLQPRI